LKDKTILMVVNWFKRFIAGIRMLFITETSAIKQTNDTNNSNSITGGIIPQDALGDGIQQEAKWFKRKNDLVSEFYGEEPIVYESDMTTIKKENQYGYVPKPGEIVYQEPDELLADDVELVVGIDKVKPITTNAEYLKAGADFEARWAEIKRKVREEEDFDGIIKGEEEAIEGETWLQKYERQWLQKQQEDQEKFLNETPPIKDESNNPNT
jgi:hypothetical protein